MPRPKLHRVVCDCLDCATAPTVSAVCVAARQEPPPKCLLIYTDHECPLGENETAATSISGYKNVPHLDGLAKAGSCGLIFYREAPQGGNLSSISQLLHQSPSDDSVAPKQLHERYNNLQTGFISTSSQACMLAEEAGMQVLPLLYSSEAQCNSLQKGLSGWPPPDIMAQTIMTILAGGASSSQDLTAATDDDTIDLLFVHIAWDLTPSGKGLKLSEASQFDASTAPLQHTQHAMAMPAGMDTTAESGHWQCAGSSAALHQWLDGLIRSLLQYSTFSSSVLTAILLRNQEADNMLQASSRGAVFEAEDFPRVIKPQQSHSISNMQTVRHCLSQSSLMIQHLPGVARRDSVQTLSCTEVRMHGGGGCLLAEHVLPELAYKLGRAAKYGA